MIKAARGIDVPWRLLISAQLIGWGLLSGALMISAYLNLGVLGGRSLAEAVCFGAGGLLLSSMMAEAYVRMPPRLLRGFAALGVVLVSCFLGSVLWLMLLVVCDRVIGVPPMWHAMSTSRRYVISFVRGILVLGTWSALFLVALLSRRIRQEHQHSVRAQALAQSTQMQLMRAQLNPHFLFNVLNSVVALVDEDPTRAKRMVRDLATLLRQALNERGDERGTVRDELEFVRLYLRCEQARFEDDLDVTLEVDDDALEAPLPPMMLQPLVENAIKHGLHTSKPPLRVRIQVRLDGQHVDVSVANTGKLREPSNSVIGTGTGLRNISKRLRHLFPERHSFELSNDDEWVTARIRYLPSTETT